MLLRSGGGRTEAPSGGGSTGVPINRSRAVLYRARTSSVVRVVFVANFDATFAAFFLLLCCAMGVSMASLTHYFRLTLSRISCVPY